jgi:hypothetical protein
MGVPGVRDAKTRTPVNIPLFTVMGVPDAHHQRECKNCNPFNMSQHRGDQLNHDNYRTKVIIFTGIYALLLSYLLCTVIGVPDAHHQRKEKTHTPVNTCPFQLQGVETGGRWGINMSYIPSF